MIVDETVAQDLTAELGQFKQDMIGDGWTVSMHDGIEGDAAPRMIDDDNVWDNTDPNNAVAMATTTTQYRTDLQTVKDMIAADADDDTLKAIVIIGHVTVPYSGTTSYDNHGGRAMPTDQYYADLDGTPTTWGDSSADVSYPTTNFRGQKGWEFTWNTPGDGRFDANFVPGDGLELSFGRIDMANLSTAFTSCETDLLKSYFRRNHNYRTGLFSPENKALLQTDSHGGAHPDFTTALGSGTADTANWYTKFTDTGPTHYLFASRTGSSTLHSFDNGDPGPQKLGSYNVGDATTYPQQYGQRETPVHAVFTMAGGSFMGDWNNRSIVTYNNIDYLDAPAPSSADCVEF